jgi:hypothetical protein
MSCPETNPCNPPCPDLYDNCGCLNPTTFGCVTYQGTALECSGIENGENGDDILAKLDEKICDIGKVMLNADDVCPEYLEDKIAAGTNITITYTGTGCDRQMVIHAIEGGEAIDEHVKVSEDDTTTGYLNEKLVTGTYLTKNINNPAGNEELELDVVPATLISADAGNQLVLGTDGALKTLYTVPDGSETIVTEGVGVIVTGSGTLADPYVVSTNPSIQVVRSCFDSVWRNVTIVPTGNPNVVFTSGAPQYRYRYDGTVEFRGQLTYNVSFGAYSTSNRKFTVTVGNIPTTCLTGGELAGVADLKGVNYIDVPQASADQIVQQYGYIIRKSTNNLILEFQSSFTASTAKSIVVNFEGCVIHPLI